MEALSWRAPEAREGSPASQEWTLSEQASRQILRVCNQSDLSLFILMATMFKAFAARCTGDETVNVLAPAYPDGRAAKNGVVPLTNRVELAASVRDNMLETRRTIVGAYSSRPAPISEVLDPKTVEDMLRDNPICVSGNIHAGHAPPCPAVLEFRFTRHDGRILCALSFDSARLRPDLVAELGANFEQFLVAASADYAVSVGLVDWLWGDRLAGVLALGRGAAVAGPNLTLDEMFVEQASRTPDEPALICGARTISYGELEALSALACRNLQKMGIEPGQTIAIHLPPGIEVVALFLAALRIGAVFVPIGIGEPPQRLRRLLDKQRPDLLIVGDEALDQVAAARTAIMSQLFEPLRTAPLVRALPAARGGTAAYLIFTSGTSGEPKPVVVDHAGIANAVNWKIREYGLSPKHRVLPLFGHEFDGFLLNVFAPLCSGASVALLDEQERRNPRFIAACIDRQAITQLVTAPLLYDAVLDHDADKLSSLQWVTLAGEAAETRTIARSKRVAPHIRLSNEYGPTENSVVSTYRAELDPESARVIGTPIDNVNLYILDAQRNFVPPGITGEIFLGGRGLARACDAGNDDIGNGFIQVRGERLYQTGDLACWLPDGNVEFKGRRDHHVKVRGKRVSLDEIRTAIIKRAEISEAVVLHASERAGDMLYAYVVADGDLAVDALLDGLRQDLPPHMVPNRIIPLPALPLNAGGKVSRAALQAMLPASEGLAPNQQPKNDLERQLVEIWRAVLEIDQVGVEESFFSLGGHSLRAVRLLTEIHEALGVELSLDQIFTDNSVRRLADTIMRQRLARSEPQPDRGDDDRDDGSTLSPAQERMLALTNEHPVSYNLPILFELGSNLDLDRLRRAVETVLSRHPALRASFRLEDGRWTQTFNDEISVGIETLTLSPGADIEEVERETLRSFDLEKAPLLRVTLFSELERHKYLLFDFHHIVIDEVSLGIVLRELAFAYDGVALPPLPPGSYADYARSQRRRRRSTRYGELLAAAAHKLGAGNIEPLRLPFDHLPSRRRGTEGRLARRKLGREVVAAIRRLCATSEVTEFTFFTAAFGLLLNKYTHQSTIVIGAPVSLRPDAETREVVGLCLNTMPFRLDIPADATFGQYLRGVSAGVIDDLGRSQVEFDDLVKSLHRARDFAENPLFSVMLNMVDAQVTGLPFRGIEAKYRPLHNGTCKFDLLLELDLDGDESSFSFEYPTARFEEATIDRLCDSFLALLEGIVARPDAEISSLQILSRTEQARLFEWSRAGQTGSYEDGSPAALFEQRVRERPEDIAVVFGDERITYADLNAASNRLAHKLLALDCREDEVVAVFCERSPSAIIGILAVQKAGGAHLPLDPFYPLGRTGTMLSDSGARILITDQDVSALPFAGAIVRMDSDLSVFSSADPGLERRAESLAYVLYTSGTTGGPKGVMVAQRNLMTLVRRATADLALDRRDIWTLFHSLCFDVSVWEMFGALLTGARLVIVPRVLAADPGRLLQLIEANRVTVLCQPPSAFYLLADAMVAAGRSTSIRYVLLGGEAIKPENLKQWHERYGDPGGGGGATLINGYGITETTVYSTFKTVGQREIQGHSGSIGRPVPGTFVHVLDPGLNLCPIGVVGELFIGGLGVGRGYLGQPELTRSRFLDDPFNRGGLLYRSGDLVRWLPNGEIEYLCRADKQVKIRGYRVETGEVEAAMTAYSAVRESVVLATAQAETTQLLGFFTSDMSEDLTAMRSHLEDMLPNYMVPSKLVQVDQMPVTPNGKVDHAQLLAERPSPPSHASRAPATGLEKLLASTWAEIIGIPLEEVGGGDSFFALGGDSIGANLVVKLLEARGVPIELLDLFENPALGALADVIRSRNSAWGDDSSPGAAERSVYWAELAASDVTPVFGASEWSGPDGDKPLICRVSVPLGDLLPALGRDEDGSQLHEVLLAALVLSLRIWSGADSCRIGLLTASGEPSAPGTAEAPARIAAASVAIKDINLGRENLELVRAGIRRAADYALDWDDALADPASAAAIAGAILFLVRAPDGPDAPSVSQNRESGRPYFTSNALPPGALLADCVVSGDAATLRLMAPAGAPGAERLQFLGEAFKLGLRETMRALPVDLAPRRPARTSIDVQPFSEIFFKDCTHQAILPAIRHFGGDIDLVLANSAAVCVQVPGRSCGLRLGIRHIERRPFDALLVDAGIAMQSFSGSTDICEDLMECLSRGALGIAKLDCYFVSRQRDLFHKKHGEHTILICGYDCDRGLFEIIDNEAASNVQYRRTTIGVDELRQAYDGYQQRFNPRRSDDSFLIVSAEPGRGLRPRDEAAARRLVLETLRLARDWQDEEQAAWVLLCDDFRGALSSDATFMQHVEQFSFTIGEALNAKRLLSHQVGRILNDLTLSTPVDEMVSNLETVYGVLMKLRLSRNYDATRLRSMLTRLEETRQLHLEYAESRGKLLGGE